jgi:hypothetical protein
MMLVVIVSYVLAGIFNLLYGHYDKLNISTFRKAIAYPITAIILELPNILVMYLIHWKSYKPQTAAVLDDED